MNLCPFSYFANGNGAPNAGGFITTYVAGSSSEKPTYTNNTGSTPHPNPIVIPANGIVYIWLATDSAYKLVVTDSSSNPLNTIDQVVPITSFAAIAGGANIDMTGFELYTTGNANLDLNPGGSGTVTFNGIGLPTAVPVIGQVMQVTSATTIGYGSISASSLSTLTDATITTPIANNVLQYDGSKWVNKTLAAANIAAADATWTSASITDLGSSSITFTNKAGLIGQWDNSVTQYATPTSATVFTNKTGAISQWTNDRAYLDNAFAVKAGMQTPTATNTVVNPAMVQQHPCVPKVYCQFQMKTAGTAACTLRNNFGVTSITRVTTSTYDVVFSTAFSDTTFAGMVFQAGFLSNATVNGFPNTATASTTTTCRLTIVQGDSLDNYATLLVYGAQ